MGKEETFDKMPLQREEDGGLFVLLLSEHLRSGVLIGSGSDFLLSKELPATRSLSPKLESSSFSLCISGSSCLLETREVFLVREMGGRVRATGLGGIGLGGMVRVRAEGSRWFVIAGRWMSPKSLHR